MQFEVVHGFYHRSCLFGRGEIGKGKPSEDAIVEVIIESVGQGQAQLSHKRHELLLLYGKRNILDDNGSGNKLLIDVVGKIFLSQRVPAEGGVGVPRVQIGKGEGWQTLGLIDPSLASNVSAKRLS